MADAVDSGDPPLVSGVPVLHLPGFDGPMDLLLDLAERQRIDLGRISILELAKQFVAAMERLQRHVAIERRADWLVVATRLLLLRSRLLFPASPQAKAQAAREAGREIERVQQMAATRAAMAWLEGRPQLDQEAFARPHGHSQRVTSYMALMEACLTVLRGRERQHDDEEPVRRAEALDLWRVQDALVRVHALLIEHPEGGNMLAFLPPLLESPNREQKAKAAVSSTLLAALELARAGEVCLEQGSLFDTILVSARPPSETPDMAGDMAGLGGRSRGSAASL